LTVTRVSADGSQTTQVRFDDRFGKAAAIADPNGIDQTWSYDELGIQRIHRGPTGQSDTTYALGTPRTINGVFVESTYSVTVAKVGGPLATATDEFNSFGQIVRHAHTGLGGNEVSEEYAYDPKHRLTVVNRPHLQGDTTQSYISYSYDDLDRVTAEFYPNGENVRHDYALVRFASMPDWQAEGAIVAARTTANTGIPYDPDIQTVVLTDRDNQVVRAIDGLSQHTDYEYGAFGELARVTDPAGRTIDVDHDGWSRAISVLDMARGGTETTDHNGFGDVVFTEDAADRTASYVYDDFGRLTKLIDHTDDGDLTSQWIYDGDGTNPNTIGRLVSTVSPTNQSTHYGYEGVSTDRNRGLLTNVTRHFVMDESPGLDLATDYQYDDFGNITHIDYPSAFGTRPAVNQVFDDFGNLTQVEDAANPGFCYWRLTDDDQGYRIKQARLGTACNDDTGGNTTNFAYDELSGTLTSIVTSNGYIGIEAVGYNYDLLGRVIGRFTSGGVLESYSYDPLSRLTHVNEVETYSYDAEGRGRLATLSTADGSTNTYDYYSDKGRDWIHTAGPWTYTQDAVGNVKTRSRPGVVDQTFDYTPFDLPRSINSNGAVTLFDYDADENRIVKRSPTTTTFYAGALHQQIEQLDGTQYARSRIYAGGVPVAELVTDSTGSTSTRYLLTDALGTVQTTALPDGTVDGQRDYTAFGEPRGTNTGLGQSPYGFTGQEEDTDLGLVNMNGRLYDPVLGQFLQADPVISAPVSQGLNRYAYVNNSPLNATDPSGFCPSIAGYRLSNCIGNTPLPLGENNAWGYVADVMLYGGIAAGAVYGGYELGQLLASSAGTSLASVAAGPELAPEPGGDPAGYAYLEMLSMQQMSRDFRQPSQPHLPPPQTARTRTPTQQGQGHRGRRNPSAVASTGESTHGDSDFQPVPGAADAAPALGPWPKVQHKTQIGKTDDAHKFLDGVAHFAFEVAITVVAPEEKILRAAEKLVEAARALRAARAAEKGIVAANGTKILGYTKHGIDRAIGDAGKRAGTKATSILDALKNPKSIKSGVDELGRPFQTFEGSSARVVVNPETGQIVSVNPIGGAGVR
jgi:RHS repeat-associated protein